MPKTRRVVAVVVLVALGAGIAWMLLREEGTEQSSPAASRGTGPRGGDLSRSGISSGDSSPQFPAAPPVQAAPAPVAARLPPPGTKVIDVVAQLKADADRGEPRAACRLGAELTRCWQIQQRLAARNLALSRSDSKLQDPASAVDEELCEGVTASQTDNAWRYLLTAALAGSAAAMSQFLVAPPLSTLGGSAQGWSAYQQYYEDFLDRSIRRGDVRALYTGYFAAETGMGAGGRGVQLQDPRRALVFGLALLPLVDMRTSQQIQAALPHVLAKVADPTKAAEEATTLGSGYFGGRAPENISPAMSAVKPEACGD